LIQAYSKFNKMRRFFIGSKSGEQDKSNKSDNIHLSKDLRNKINLFYLLT